MFLSLLYVNIGDDTDRPSGRQWLGDTYRVHQRLWMAFPDDPKRPDLDPFFLGSWNVPAAPDPKPPRAESGFLFRIERDGIPRILVQSTQRPQWDYAFQNAPYLLAGGRQTNVREFDPAPSRDQAYRFRLLANVISSKSVPHPDGKMRTTKAGLTIHRRRRTEVPVYPNPIPDPLPADPVERRKLLLACWEPWQRWLDHLSAERGFRVVNEKTSPLRMEACPTTVRIPAKNKGGPNQPKFAVKHYNAGLFEGVLVCTDPKPMHDAITDGVGHGKAFGFGLMSVASL